MTGTAQQAHLERTFSYPCPVNSDSQLALFDHGLPNLLIPYVLVFEQSSEHSAVRTSEVLQKAVSALCDEFPLLAHDATLLPESERSGSFKYRLRPRELQLTVQNKSDQFSYQDMKQSNFDDKFLPLGVFDSSKMPDKDTQPVPMCRIKATSIEGGFVLSISYNHLFGDAFSYDLATAALARFCTAAANGQPFTSALSSDGQVRKLLDQEIPDSPTDKPASCLTTSLPPQEDGYEVEHCTTETFSQVYRIDRSSLKRLKSDTTPNTADTQVSWISTHDAVCALLFRTLMRARHLSGIIKDDDELNFSIAIDVRNYLPNLPKDWVGNAVSALYISINARDLFKSDGLTSLAAAIRTSIEGVDEINVKNFFAHAKGIPGCMLLDNQVGRSSATTGGMLTTWRNFPPGTYSWPAEIGKFQVMRYPGSWQPLGWIVIWPEMSDGTWEISTVMEAEVGRHFVNDKDFSKFATAAWDGRKPQPANDS